MLSTQVPTEVSTWVLFPLLEYPPSHFYIEFRVKCETYFTCLLRILHIRIQGFQAMMLTSGWKTSIKVTFTIGSFGGVILFGCSRKTPCFMQELLVKFKSHHLEVATFKVHMHANSHVAVFLHQVGRDSQLQEIGRVWHRVQIQ